MDEITCPSCGGDGELVTSHAFRCYYCNGRGKLIKDSKEHKDSLESEKNIARTIDNSVSLYEYRKMG